MAQINIRRTGEIVRVLFKILLANPDGIQAGEAIAQVKSQVTLTEWELSEIKSGGVRIDQVVRFATVDCAKAGWLTKHKGTWSLTDEGRAAYERYPDPEEFFREASRGYRAWKAAQPLAASIPAAPVDVDADVDQEEKSVSITYEQADEEAWAEIQHYVERMDPYEFQNLAAGLLRAMGYHVSWVAPAGKDGGIDVVAWSDPLGTRPPRIKVQVKRQIQRVNADGLRSFMATISDDDVGIFICSGGFTRDAMDLARTQERRKMTLINLDRLFDLWVEYYKQLDDAARRLLPLQPIWFLAPRS